MRDLSCEEPEGESEIQMGRLDTSERSLEDWEEVGLEPRRDATAEVASSWFTAVGWLDHALSSEEMLGATQHLRTTSLDGDHFSG